MKVGSLGRKSPSHAYGRPSLGVVILKFSLEVESMLFYHHFLESLDPGQQQIYIDLLWIYFIKLADFRFVLEL